jgi:hypothetical protein
VAVFLVAMGLVTEMELFGQRSVPAFVGGSDESGTTTIGALTNVAIQRDQTPSTPSTPPTSAPATSAEDSPRPSDASETTTTAPGSATSTATASTSD